MVEALNQNFKIIEKNEKGMDIYLKFYEIGLK